MELLLYFFIGIFSTEYKLKKSRFQFLEDAFKSMLSIARNNIISHFNSLKVRLKAEISSI